MANIDYDQPDSPADPLAEYIAEQDAKNRALAQVAAIRDKQRNAAQGLQGAQAAQLAPPWPAGRPWLEQGLQDEMNHQLGKIVAQNRAQVGQQAPAKIANTAKVYRDEKKIGTKSQEKAVVQELMDALEYLMADMRETARHYPHLEALTRNWAMRRAAAALEHGRAML